jgi:endo-1,4-beta-xylanase
MATQPPVPADRSQFRARMHEHWQASSARIARDTRANRMAQATLRVVGGDGRPLAGADVALEQIRGPVRFGANAFMLGGNGSPAADLRWEELFAGAFDLAVLPLFWKDVEPERGRLRFEAGSPPRYRRPPIDEVLAFCDRHRIEPKAHVLTYHQFVPDWVPRDPAGCEAAHEAWFAQLGSRYRSRIPSWDVVNEAQDRWGWIWDEKPLPRDWIKWSFAAARRHFPGCRLILNEATHAWVSTNFFGRETHPFMLLVHNLLLQGVAVDEIGLQFHLFDYQEQDFWKKAAGAKDLPRLLEPDYLLMVLDHYASFGLPVHISEITVPCYGVDDDARALQAEIAEMLYRTWFSHRSVASMVWWNTVDGHAYGREGELRGALLDKDLGEKPVYSVLRRLIREEWRTRTSGRTGGDGSLAFEGFLGGYRVTVIHGGRRETIEIDLPGTGAQDLQVACPGLAAAR